LQHSWTRRRVCEREGRGHDGDKGATRNGRLPWGVRHVLAGPSVTSAERLM
jgi:hypothetical protein